MKIIRPENDADDVDCQLLAAMLNYECGAQVYSPSLEKNPPPYSLWPIITQTPTTSWGVESEVHYRPSVGVVFYAALSSTEVSRLVARLASRLKSIGHAHLMAERVTGVTPTAVIRQKATNTTVADPRVDKTLVVGPRECYTVPVEGIKPARLMLWVSQKQKNLPLSYSVRAAFTWVFMPISILIEDKKTSKTMNFVNAMVASIFYDPQMLSSLDNGAETYVLSDLGLDLLCKPRFEFPQIQNGKVPYEAKYKKHEFNFGDYGHDLHYDSNRNLMILVEGALMITRAGKITYFGCCSANPSQASPGLPEDTWEWNDRDLILRQPGHYQCVICDAPLSDDVVILFNVKELTFRGGITKT